VRHDGDGDGHEQDEAQRQRARRGLEQTAQHHAPAAARQVVQHDDRHRPDGHARPEHVGHEVRPPEGVAEAAQERGARVAGGEEERERDRHDERGHADDEGRRAHAAD
jgi:hypothetical protein